ncbi:MAG: hypothetical protein JNN04_10160 [Cyclobacteriaceae bacterium]|nr:hypothetical protein [Cyclobacteriaceae bacterium]
MYIRISNWIIEYEIPGLAPLCLSAYGFLFTANDNDNTFCSFLHVTSFLFFDAARSDCKNMN